MSSTRDRADDLAAQLKAAGFTVERHDYPTDRTFPQYGERHYVIVHEGENRVEGQTNDLLAEGNFAGYSGPDGQALLERVRAVVR